MVKQLKPFKAIYNISTIFYNYDPVYPTRILSELWWQRAAPKTKVDTSSLREVIIQESGSFRSW